MIRTTIFFERQNALKYYFKNNKTLNNVVFEIIRELTLSEKNQLTIVALSPVHSKNVVATFDFVELETEYSLSNTADNADITQSQARDIMHRRIIIIIIMGTFIWRKINSPQMRN